MFLIKALLAGLAGVSICMADISGIVINANTLPVSGAVVRLEKGGQTVTTDMEGKFTIAVTVGVHNKNNPSLQNNLSAKMHNGVLFVTVAEKSAVEITTFNLSGKALSTRCMTVDAGSHAVTVPQNGAGIYLYKVKLGNSEFVVKGNTIGKATMGNAVISNQEAEGKALRKVATAVINDIIAITKTGYLNYRCVQYNGDTSGMVIKMLPCEEPLTDIDGNVYQTVKIGSQVWMAENLRVTKFNDGTGIPLAKDTYEWSSIWDNKLYTPAYCFNNNTENADSIKRYGALYNWYSIGTKKIAPTGWHVPTDSEWTVLQKFMGLNGYNWDKTLGNRIAKSLAAKTDWAKTVTEGEVGCDLTKNNSSGFSALPGGYRIASGYFGTMGGQGNYWSATDLYMDDGHTKGYVIAYIRYIQSSTDSLFHWGYIKACGCSVRLLRDN